MAVYRDRAGPPSEVRWQVKLRTVVCSRVRLAAGGTSTNGDSHADLSARTDGNEPDSDCVLIWLGLQAHLAAHQRSQRMAMHAVAAWWQVVGMGGSQGRNMRTTSLPGSGLGCRRWMAHHRRRLPGCRS